MAKREDLTEDTRTFGRLRRKTGQPAYFKAWIANRGIAAYLKGIRTIQLMAEDDLSVMPKALAALSARWKTVYALTRATRADLLATPAVGPRSLAKLEKYLTDRGVPIAWSENYASRSRS